MARLRAVCVFAGGCWDLFGIFSKLNTKPLRYTEMFMSMTVSLQRRTCCSAQLHCYALPNFVFCRCVGRAGGRSALAAGGGGGPRHHRHHRRHHRQGARGGPGAGLRGAELQAAKRKLRDMQVGFCYSATTCVTTLYVFGQQMLTTVHYVSFAKVRLSGAVSCLCLRGYTGRLQQSSCYFVRMVRIAHTDALSSLFLRQTQAERERQRGRKVLKVAGKGGGGGSGGGGGRGRGGDRGGGDGGASEGSEGSDSSSSSSSGEEQLEALHDLDLRVHVDVGAMAAGGACVLECVLAVWVVGKQLEALHDLDLRVHVDVGAMAAGGARVVAVWHAALVYQRCGAVKVPSHARFTTWACGCTRGAMAVWQQVGHVCISSQRLLHACTTALSFGPLLVKVDPGAHPLPHGSALPRNILLPLHSIPLVLAHY